MPDNLSRRQPEDKKLVNTSQQWEIDYWCNEFGITETKLKDLVKNYGNSVLEIKKHLKY